MDKTPQACIRHFPVDSRYALNPPYDRHNYNEMAMNTALYIAALLAITAGIVHSILGERYILIRLFRRADLPKLFGGTEFTTRTLRFAWHITTIAWWGFAAMLVQLAQNSVSPSSIALTVGISFVATGLVTLIISRARHFAWPVFLFIGCVALYSAAI